jgi:hypothetical protein
MKLFLVLANLTMLCRIKNQIMEIQRTSLIMDFDLRGI